MAAFVYRFLMRGVVDAPPSSLLYLEPVLCDEWHPLNTLTPSQVTRSSGRKVRWLCSRCGHNWEAKVYKRTGASKTGCPACAGRPGLLDGRNSLQTLMPELCKEWHPKNTMMPSQVTKGSGRKVLWLCSQCGHEWEAKICRRTGNNSSGCPACSGRVSCKPPWNLSQLL
jgi:hypothetical protein